ncbi:MAG: diguanylate cyclase [Chloroflexi bacterium]|nr:diguanylate cyclase [Chloroflexota bacterium]
MTDDTVKILLVEDNDDYAWMLRLVFQELNSGRFEISRFDHLGPALFELGRGKFDVILLDLTLPDSSGFETFIQTYNAAPETPIVVMTADDNKELALRAVREGAQDFLVKGDMDINQLVRAIEYAVERHRVLSGLRRMSLLDDLTGLLNRRGFITLADQHRKIAARANRDLLLFFADLDGLKQINDRHGHPAGDAALQTVAAVLKDTFRSSDLIARLGGDEFTILAIDAPDRNARTILSRLQNQLDERNAQNTRYKLTMSVGMGRFDPQKHEDIEKMMAQADRALYEQKRIKKKTGVRT